MDSLEIPLDFEILQSQNPTEQPSSAVFFLHGYGANELDLSSLSRHFPSDIFIISLRAPFPLSSGYCWYPITLSPTGEIPDTPEPNSLNQLLSTDYKFAVSFSILVIVLLFRPSGIFKGKIL